MERREHQRRERSRFFFRRRPPPLSALRHEPGPTAPRQPMPYTHLATKGLHALRGGHGGGVCCVCLRGWAGHTNEKRGEWGEGRERAPALLSLSLSLSLSPLLSHSAAHRRGASRELSRHPATLPHPPTHAMPPPPTPPPPATPGDNTGVLVAGVKWLVGE